MGKDNVQNDEVEIDIGHILSILWEKILVIIATGIIVGLAGFLVSKFLITPKYESETKLYVLNRANDSATTLSDVQLSTQLTKDYQILVTSAPVMNQVIKELGLNMKASELASTISVDTPSDTRVLQITVTSNDPKRAKDIADKVAQVSSKKICDIMKIEQVNVIEEGSLSEEPAVDTVQKWTLIGLALGIVLSCAVIIIRSMLKLLKMLRSILILAHLQLFLYQKRWMMVWERIKSLERQRRKEASKQECKRYADD